MQQRKGVLVRPVERLSAEQIKMIDHASLAILADPGIICCSDIAAGYFSDNGATLEKNSRNGGTGWIVKIPEDLVRKAVSTAPSVVHLGARKEENRLILDAHEPRVRFVSGSETNVWLEPMVRTYIREDDPEDKLRLVRFVRRRGTVADLTQAAHVAEHLEHLDSFIRTVNIQDEDIDESTKDVNKFFACLNNITKHVMGGLTDVAQLDNVIRMAEIIAGGDEALRGNPLVSFIACVCKSPLQMVADSAEKMIEVAKRGLPVVISSSPQGGSTAPVDEAGMVTQINAEILSGVALAQLVKAGAPVLYGSVPTRARMEDLHDMYGAPEFNHYNVDCAQMARFYGLPCYSTAGIADTCVPGMQATVEKLLSHIYVPMSGAHYVHYAFGLLERTNTFSLEQAVLDDAHIGISKRLLAEPRVGPDEITEALTQIREVMTTSHRLFARYVRKKLHSGELYPGYPFANDERDEVLLGAHERVKKLLEKPAPHLPQDVIKKIYQKIPGIVTRLRQEAKSE